MKIVILLGRGIEGCGVTKHTVELQNWLKKHNHSVVTYANKTKKYCRATAHTHTITELKFSDESASNAILDMCNDADYVVVNSFPATKHKEKDITAFNNLIAAIKSRIIVIQHDHNIISIRRNAGMMETVAKAHAIFAHATTNAFVEHIRNAGFTIPVQSFQPGYNFQYTRDLYWKPIEAQSTNIHRWIGRASPWKGIYAFFNLHNGFLRKQGGIAIMEGIEKSLYYKDLVLSPQWDFEDYTHEKYRYEDIPFAVDKRVYMCGVYNNAEMLERMSLSTFGYQLTTMRPRFIEHSIEYTHCETVACGVLPVFRKSFGDACLHRKTGIPLSQCADTGTVWLDDTNMAAAAELIQRLAQDSGMRNEWREAAYEFYTGHQGTGAEFARLFGLQNTNNMLK